ncbi:molybdopterin molybdotransferase [Roseovarius azorensis]|uniref:Molybdopterin molybdenumtransferase n=1 Tax=Roseovarius azorensis TaxID=1287727 RepID=A0A1H7H3N1_9RHOB|nr:gephyrin-like molybdotransferase Glp [Roseovarius azorensis]SEK44909.1 molybdopterin molybdotransferase [Roseovarius azorensis]
MTGFDTVLVVDWSAASKRAPKTPSKDAIWMGLVSEDKPQEPIYCRSRIEAEERIAAIFREEMQAGRRLLAAFDFPFGYPRGFARRIIGSDNPLLLWDWLAERIEDSESGANNRFDVAQDMNAAFDGPGPLWGKTHRDRWPGIPYRKDGIHYTEVPEKRTCDRVGGTSSSCFQLCYNPTVGSQVLMGLPMLSRLRRIEGVAVWPFEDWRDARVVLAEIWPGTIESQVKQAVAQRGVEVIRDREQVRLLSCALSRLSAARLDRMMTDLPPEALEEAWVLGAGHEEELMAACDDPLKPPPLRDDCFALPAGVDWTPVDAALDLLRERLRSVVGQERVPLAQAAGRVLAAPVTARRANPPEANTAVDGYGFAHAGLGAGDQVLPLVEGRAAAGVPFAGLVPKGHALRVLTGAALPEGVDTVILQEDVTPGEGRIAFRGGLKKGANTRRAGEDVAAGAVVLERGRVLTPADLALCAAVGLADLPVQARLRVAVISTGDELVEPGAAARAGQIYDANRPMLAALVRQMGHDPLDLGRVADDRAALRAALDRGAAEADAILTSGGASSGDEDHVSALLNEAGAMAEWRIAIKPGRPLALGMWRGVPVFGLPGNPVAALVCTLIFARPAMAVLSGANWSEPQGFDVPAGFAKSKKPGRREYLRARMRDGCAEVFKSEGSGRISGLSWAEGLVELSEDAAEIRPGDPVRYIPFGSFLGG